MVISHGTADGNPGQAAEAHELYARSTAPFQLRSYGEVLRFFDGLELIEPGLVRIALWRPDTTEAAGDPERIAGYAGVWCKR